VRRGKVPLGPAILSCFLIPCQIHQIGVPSYLRTAMQGLDRLPATKILVGVLEAPLLVCAKSYRLRMTAGNCMVMQSSYVAY
jgi:hypothetical protein